MQGLPYGVPFTLDQAYPFINNSIVALGFPDIIYKTKDIYIKLLKRLKEGNTDVVLGLFPADHPQNADGVEVDSDGIIHRVFAKPSNTRQHLVWAAAVWKPALTHFIHEHIENFKDPSQKLVELQIGHIVQIYIEQGHLAAGICVSDHPPIDIGTPANYSATLQKMWNKEN
jgi:glucose-1-phosphate thymidylyltransferase